MTSLLTIVVYSEKAPPFDDDNPMETYHLSHCRAKRERLTIWCCHNFFQSKPSEYSQVPELLFSVKCSSAIKDNYVLYLNYVAQFRPG